MKHFLCLIAICFLSVNLSGQSDIRIGEWKSYLPHNSAKHITQSDEKIIIATDFSIYTIDKVDGTVDFLSKVSGLSDTGIEEIEYDPFNDVLVIAYDNSVVDIINGSEVSPIFDIQTNTNFINRKINDIFVQNSEWVYFATGFGVVQYNLMDREFGFTLDAGQEFTQISGDDDYLLASGPQGVYYLDYRNETFPNAFSSWVELDDNLGGEEILASRLINGNVYAGSSGKVFLSESFGAFEEVVALESDETIQFIKKHEEGWLLGFRKGGSASEVMIYDDQNGLVQEITTCANRIRDLEITEDGSIYFADEWIKLRTLDAEGNCRRLSFKGPAHADATDIDIERGTVYVASGGITESFKDEFGRQGVYLLNDGEWTNLDQDVVQLWKDNDVIQFYQIEAHPIEPKYYIGSFWAGVIEVNEETGEQILYNPFNTNGALEAPISDTNEERVRIAGLYFDDQRNLWMTAFGSEKSIAVLTAEGTWHSFSGGSNPSLTDILVDDLGFAWAVTAGNNGGVVVYDPGESIPDPTDDQTPRVINSGNSEIPSNIVNAIAKDLDGSIWVGTAAGAVVFECGSDIFDPSRCSGFKPQVQQPDGNIGFLLATEDVQAITVDGANRKWFGTRNGIFVMSPSGEDQIAKFDEENSPLFDNNIKALEYNPASGEIFISSNKGVQSYRTETTGAGTRHSADVYAFPNPVRPEYNGDIAIKGLARDAEVIITDVDGQLVYKTEALGGQAIWDGSHLNGNAVSGGVYLVFSSSTDTFRSADSFVTKILVIR